MAVLLGLASALVYGAADFLGGMQARRSGALAVVVWSQLAGLALLLAALPLLSP
ncbi:MAG: EamA family transporter, partial [Actinomycetota bacterium]|nr:EamA family transporter [Actinomycetota bacterium]